YNLLTRVQSGQKGLPAQYWLFNSRTKKIAAGPTQTLAQLKSNPKVRQLKPLKPLPAKTKAKAAAKRKTQSAAAGGLTTTPGFPTGYQLMTTPTNTVVITCDSTSSVVCPGLATPPAPGATYYYLFKHDLNADPPSPAMTGTELKLKGTQQDFDPSTG